MKQSKWKTFAIAALACVCMAASVPGSAQGYGQRNGYGQGRYRQDSWTRDTQSIVNRTERESNAFRSYFEHNFRSRGHSQKWTGYGTHPEHEARNGQMSLQDAIQNLDEDFERLRTEVDHYGRTARARDLMSEIVDHSRDVDQRIARVGDSYSYGNDRNWRYDRSSELYTRWQELRNDINRLSRQFEGRGR